MRTATELLAELIEIYEDPEKDWQEVQTWLHRQREEIRGVLEGGVDDTARLDWFSEQHGTQHQLAKATWCTHSIDVPEFLTLREKMDRARGEGSRCIT